MRIMMRRMVGEPFGLRVFVVRSGVAAGQEQ